MPSIRSLVGADFDAFVALRNSIWPEFPTSVDQLLHEEEEFEPHMKPTRLAAEIDGAIVGAAEVGPIVGSYDPRIWTIAIDVAPECRGKGIGSALFDTAWRTLAPSDPTLVTVHVHDGDEASMKFLAARGFAELKRDFVSELDLSAWSVAPPAHRAPEVRIVPMLQLDSEAFRQELHQLFEAVRKDVPRVAPASPLSFDFFNKAVIGDPEFLWSASHVAIAPSQRALGYELVGFTGMYQSAQAGFVDQWLTGVRPEWRGKGIAKALKIAAANAAKNAEFKGVRTDNDSRNAAMLSVNRTLGFVARTPVVVMAWRPAESKSA